MAESDYSMYCGRLTYEAFQESLKEYVTEQDRDIYNQKLIDELYSFAEGDSEPRRINPTPLTVRFNTLADMEGAHVTAQGPIPSGTIGIVGDTSYAYDGENWITQMISTSIIERMRPLQDELNSLQYRNWVALMRESYKDTKLVPEKEETIDEDLDFLKSIG